jgi:hypothetical protein
MLDEASWRNPIDQTVALVDPAGRTTHRSGMLAMPPVIDGEVGIGGSTWAAHWLEPAPTAYAHGSGLPGRLLRAGDLEVRSLVRGAWEVRLVRVTGLAGAAEATGIQVGGWPIAGDVPTAETGADGAVVGNGALRSELRLLLGSGGARVELRADSSPLGAISAAPVIDLPVSVGDWSAVLLTLSGVNEAIGGPRASVELADADGDLAVHVVWPDGLATTHRLTDPRPVTMTVGHQDRAQG